jgi:glutaredoxin
MYGAYWCPHCHDQKQLFGKEAAAQLNYIECAPDGKNGRPDLCEAAKIEGFPAWEIDNQKVEGTQSLERLAELTGYQGLRNFQNSVSGPVQK